MLNKIALSAGCIFLASCSSLNSIDTPSEADGLTYYLPKKDFQVFLALILQLLDLYLMHSKRMIQRKRMRLLSP